MAYLKNLSVRSRIIMNNKLGRMWKCHGLLFDILSQQLPGGTAETHEKSVMTAGVLVTV
jgi:hypothetical protein